MEFMGFATIDSSKSVRSTNSIFAHKKDIGITIEKMQKKRNFKILDYWVLPNDGRIVVHSLGCVHH